MTTEADNSPTSVHPTVSGTSCITTRTSHTQDTSKKRQSWKRGEKSSALFFKGRNLRKAPQGTELRPPQKVILNSALPTETDQP
ncbi:hypothetical protein RRG08_019382 [Elysia crispata]|uniref:Uncharacterized protein n=1 Tax=Elysia crispata TaxID=231223 RepID=A0AAE0XTT6_9GAST|nr:hypothetical protein RRG08_019382 [Elysia crispata]